MKPKLQEVCMNPVQWALNMLEEDTPLCTYTPHGTQRPHRCKLHLLKLPDQFVSDSRKKVCNSRNCLVMCATREKVCATRGKQCHSLNVFV